MLIPLQLFGRVKVAAFKKQLEKHTLDTSAGTVEIDEKGEEVFVIEGSFSDELGVHRSWSWCRSWLKIEGAAWVAVARDRNMDRS